MGVVHNYKQIITLSKTKHDNNNNIINKMFKESWLEKYQTYRGYILLVMRNLTVRSVKQTSPKSYSQDPARSKRGAGGMSECPLQLFCKFSINNIGLQNMQ